VNVAVELPAGTVTVAGTVAAPLPEPEASATDRPPVGAFPVRVTVPVEDVPPATEVGLRLTLLTPAVVTARFALEVEVSGAVAVMLAVALLTTGVVDTVNVPVFEPAATVTVPGTVAAALPDVRLRT